MRIDDDERVFISWGQPGSPATFTTDPTGGVVTLEVVTNGAQATGSPYATAWTVNPSLSGGAWTGIVTSTKFFVGTGIIPGGQDVALSAGRSYGQFIAVMPNGERLTGPVFPIDLPGSDQSPAAIITEPVIDGGTP